MRFTIRWKSLEWWFFAAILAFTTAGLLGWKYGLPGAAVAAGVQLAYSIARRGFLAFGSQTRAVFLTCALVGLADPTRLFMTALYPFIVLVTLFDWCIIARLLVLMPWNSGVVLNPPME